MYMYAYICIHIHICIYPSLKERGESSSSIKEMGLPPCLEERPGPPLPLRKGTWIWGSKEGISQTRGGVLESLRCNNAGGGWGGRN